MFYVHVFLHLDMCNMFTRSHQSKGENRTKNRGKKLHV